MLKTIVVLANSIKKGGRCVAGQQVEPDGSITDWLRPISTENEGTLMPQHMVMDDGKPLRVLDIVEIPLNRHIDDGCHPEDWLVGADKWQRKGRLNAKDLKSLVDTPPDLWKEGRFHTDRVSCSTLLSRENHQSLYLIHPKDLRLRLCREHNPFAGYVQKKSRAVFTYNSTEYNLSLTDPDITTHYCTHFPKVDEEPIEFQLPWEDRCLMCVSLTPVFNGYHYKVAATILKL